MVYDLRSDANKPGFGIWNGPAPFLEITLVAITGSNM
jgi:hypothetical protein